MTGDAASGVFSGLSSWLAQGAAALVAHVLSLIGATTATFPARAANSGPTWFADEEGFMLALMGFVILPMLLVATVGAVARQDLARLGRTWLVALPVSIMAALVGVEITRGALSLTDSLSSAVFKVTKGPQPIGSAIEAIAGTDAGHASGGSVAVLFIAVLAIIAGIGLWIELVIRNAAIYVALLFLPLALSGLVWPSTSRMSRRLVEILVALILSKFVIAAVLALGAGAVSGGGVDGGLTGVAILLLAGFAPFTLLRMAPIVEAGAVAHLEGLSRRPYHAAQAAPATARSLSQPLRAAILGNRSASPPEEENPVRSAGIDQQPGGYAPGGYPPDGGSPDRQAPGGHGETGAFRTASAEAAGAGSALAKTAEPPPSGRSGSDR